MRSARAGSVELGVRVCVCVVVRREETLRNTLGEDWTEPTGSRSFTLGPHHAAS